MTIAAEQQSFYLVLLFVLLLVQPVAANEAVGITVGILVACLQLAIWITAIRICVRRCKLRQQMLKEEAIRRRIAAEYAAIIAISTNRQGNIGNVNGNSTTSTRANPAIYPNTIQPPPPGFVYEWPNVSNNMNTVPGYTRSADDGVCLIDAAVPPSYDDVVHANTSSPPSYSEA